jgi:hypothetical protein
LQAIGDSAKALGEGMHSMWEEQQLARIANVERTRRQ